MGLPARKSRAASTKSSGDQSFGTDTGTGIGVDAEATTRPRRRTRTIATVIEEARTNAAGTKTAEIKAAGMKAAGTKTAGINTASTNAAGTKSADTASTATGTTPQHQGRSLQACSKCTSVPDTPFKTFTPPTAPPQARTRVCTLHTNTQIHSHT